MCWIKELNKFNFIINYQSEKKETQSDILLKQKQNMSKKTNSHFTHREMQLLKFEIFEKTNCINVFTVLNVHISLNEKEKSNNKQEKVVVFK